MSSGWLARIIPLLAGVFLCFLVVLSPQQLSGGPDDGASGGGHKAYANSLIAPEDEIEIGGKRPVNADYLSALLLVFLAAILGAFAGGWMGGRDQVFLLLERRLPSVVPRRPRGFTNALLEVFRL